MHKLANRSPQHFSVKPEIITRRFRDVATIQDMGGFQHALADLFEDYVAARQLDSDGVQEKLQASAAALVSDAVWQPAESDIQRGRGLMLKEFSDSGNLGWWNLPAWQASRAPRSITTSGRSAISH
jgi:hypothetical protein